MTTAPQDAPTYRETADLVNALRQTIRALVRSIPGGSAARTSLDIERICGVHRKLAWHIHRLCQQGDSPADARFLPTQGPYQSFLKSAASKGASQELADLARTQYDELTLFIENSCGSRDRFESMVSDADPDAARAIMAKHREAMFEAACHIYGIRAAARFNCNIVAPAKSGTGRFDLIHTDGLVDLHRQRGTEAWPVSNVFYKFLDAPGEWRVPESMEVFDKDAYRSTGVAVVPEFSTSPLPGLRLHGTPDHDVDRVMAEFGDVGLRSATTLVFGYIIRDALSNDETPNARGFRGTFATRVGLPFETLTSDVLLHESVDLKDPEVITKLAEIEGPALEMTTLAAKPVLVDETVEQAGAGIGLLSSPGSMPRYGEMLRRRFDREGLNINEFRAYRCEVRHPVMLTSVDIVFR